MVAAPTISTRDRELLAALDDPARIDPFEYAQWVERPEIQRVIAARDELRAREEHAKLTRFRDRILAEGSAALDTLKATLEKTRALATDQQLLEARRAASSITRLARACLRPLPSPAAALRAHAGAGSARPTREASAPSHRSSPPQPPHAPDPGSSSPPSGHPPIFPASSTPGLYEAVAGFTRAARRHSTAPDAAEKQSTLAEAAAYAAIHLKQQLGPDFEPWLRSRCERIGDAEALPGVVLYQDDLHGAIQFVTLQRPTGPTQCLIYAVLELCPEGHNPWTVADVVTHDDPSTPPGSPDHDSSDHDSSLEPPAHSTHPAPDDSS